MASPSMIVRVEERYWPGCSGARLVCKAKGEGLQQRRDGGGQAHLGQALPHAVPRALRKRHVAPRARRCLRHCAVAQLEWGRWGRSTKLPSRFTPAVCQCLVSTGHSLSVLRFVTAQAQLHVRLTGRGDLVPGHHRAQLHLQSGRRRPRRRGPPGRRGSTTPPAARAAQGRQTPRPAPGAPPASASALAHARGELPSVAACAVQCVVSYTQLGR